MTTILKTVFGSHLYGLSTPTSDRDYKGIFMPTPREILLGKIPNTRKVSSGPQHVRNTAEDVDSEVYSLHHFVQLALQGQTVALDLLHGNREEIATQEWYFLKDNRHRFYTKNMRSFIGYARKQAAKYGVKGSRLDAVLKAWDFLSMKGTTTIGDLLHELWEDEHCHLHLVPLLIIDDKIVHFDRQQSYWEVCGKKMTFGGKASHYVPMLKQYYEQYGHRAQLASLNQGVDWKAVSHALRVGYQTMHIFQDKTFSYPLEETPYLLAVKQGILPYNEVAGVLDRLIDALEALSLTSTLPAQPDTAFWEAWLEEVTLNSIENYVGVPL